MSDTYHALLSGDLGAQRRTIGGLLELLELTGLGRKIITGILQNAGLPARAYDEPDFPISLEQDLIILSGVQKCSPADKSIARILFEQSTNIHISRFGVLGLAMQHAPTLREALLVPITYPQLNWGRCRITAWGSEDEIKIAYDLDWSRLSMLAEADRQPLHQYAITLDIIGSFRIFCDLTPNDQLIKAIDLPFPKPSDWEGKLCAVPVNFGAPVGAIRYKPDALFAAPVFASRLGFKSAMRLVEREARMLADASTFAEKVSRWLWLYAPPLKKPEVAKLMGMSERSLTRQLHAEGSSFQSLIAQVQEERAKNLLSNPELSVAEIAYRLGYAEPAAFTRAFTSWCGTSPSRYRIARN